MEKLLPQGIIKIKHKFFNDPSWFKEISYVPQKIFLLDNTVAKNIAFTMDEAEIDYKLIEKVAKMAKIDDYINSLQKWLSNNSR